jgi:hypothetical protein
MASNRPLGVESGVEVCLLTLLNSLAADTCLGPLLDVTVDVRPHESGSDEMAGGSYGWV